MVILCVRAAKKTTENGESMDDLKVIEAYINGRLNSLNEYRNYPSDILRQLNTAKEVICLLFAAKGLSTKELDSAIDYAIASQKAEEIEVEKK